MYKFKLAQVVWDAAGALGGITRMARAWADAIEQMRDSTEEMFPTMLGKTPRTYAELAGALQEAVDNVHRAEDPGRRRLALLRLMYVSAWWAALDDGGPVWRPPSDA